MHGPDRTRKARVSGAGNGESVRRPLCDDPRASSRPDEAARLWPEQRLTSRCHCGRQADAVAPRPTAASLVRRAPDQL